MSDSKGLPLGFGHRLRRNGLRISDGYGVQAFGALNDFKAHWLASLERLVTIHIDRRKMSKKIDRVTVFIDAFLGLRINEAEALGVVEPLDLALHTHIPLLQNSITGVSSSSFAQKPVNVVDCAGLYYPLWALLVVTPFYR